MRWERFTVEAVVERAQAGDGDAAEWLLAKFRKVVLFKCRSYFLRGTDRDDMIQEGMFGLFKAVRDFRPGRGASFRTFADLCIERQLMSVTKSGWYPCHLAHLHAVFLADLPRDILHAASPSAEEIAVGRADTRARLRLLEERLSPFELRVARAYGEGKSYIEIAMLEEHPGAEARTRSSPGWKGVDNALCRIRRKIAAMVAEEEPPLGPIVDWGMGEG